MADFISRKHFARVPSFRRGRVCLSTAVLVCLLLIGSAWALDLPGISLPWKFSEIERHYSFLDEATDTRLFVVVGRMRGFDKQKVGQDELLEHVWEALSPPQMIKQLRFPKQGEQGWITQVFLGQSPRLFVAAKIFLLDKGEMRAVVMLRSSPIPFSYFESILENVRVFPREQI